MNRVELEAGMLDTHTKGWIFLKQVVGLLRKAKYRTAMVADSSITYVDIYKRCYHDVLTVVEDHCPGVEARKQIQ
jgi:hypothetical protein